MNEISLYIGNTFLDLLLLALIAWACHKVPFLSWLLGMVIVGGSFLFVVLAAPIVIFMVHLPQGNYFAAFFTLLLGAFISTPWLFIARPWLIDNLKNPDLRWKETAQ